MMKACERTRSMLLLMLLLFSLLTTNNHRFKPFPGDLTTVKPELNWQLIPAGHVVEDWVASFGGPCLVEDVEGLQGLELLFLVDLMPAEQSGNSLHFIHM